jgi:hypothetical protein
MQFKTKSIHSAKHSSPASMTDKEPKRPDPEVLEISNIGFYSKQFIAPGFEFLKLSTSNRNISKVIHQE